jgi:excisionase family DNA binding protein
MEDTLKCFVRAIVRETIAELAPHLAHAETVRLTVAECAAVAKCSNRTITGAIARGDLAAEYAGRKPVVRRSELDRWLARRPNSAPAKPDARAEARAEMDRAAKRLRRIA